MKIHIKKSTIVRPVQDTPNHRIQVTNLDLFHTKYHVPLLFLYKSTGGSNFFEIRVLKKALKEVLAAFYPVAGRLAKDEKGRIEIDCNGEGVLLIEAEIDSAMGDFGDFKPRMELRQLVPTVDYTSHISSYPLLLVQVTAFTCGGVCLGVGWHHTLADGSGSLHFINTWANLARGMPISNRPFMDRSILRGRVPPTPTFRHIEYEPFPVLNTPIQNQEYQSSSRDIYVVNLKISFDQLNILKAEAMNKENKIKYTTYEILAAHIWRCACKARGLSRDQATKLNISTDGRSRLYPPLPLGYFGNAIFQAAPIALAGELFTESLKCTAERIHKAITRLDNEYLRSSIDYLEKLDDLTSIMRSPETYRSPNLSIVSWMRLPLYGTNFGWGRPMYMRPASAFEGKGYILPSPTNDGSLSLTICLEANHMKSFQELFYNHIRSCM